MGSTNISINDDGLEYTQYLHGLCSTRKTEFKITLTDDIYFVKKPIFNPGKQKAKSYNGLE